jgi:hypothetical protein
MPQLRQMNTDTDTVKRDTLLVALDAAPLDRLRLMKTAFLAWHRAGRPRTGPFNFQPYLYGPCAFDLYSTLSDLLAERLVARAPYPVFKWADHHLTDAGRREAAKAARRLGERTSTRLSGIAEWASQQPFRALLERVYSEAPDFAEKSVLRREGIIRT